MPAGGRLGDHMSCGDLVIQGSKDVFFNGMPVARQGDRTSGHGSWVPNSMSEGSPNVFANGKAVCRVGDRHIGHASPSPGAFHRTPLSIGSPNIVVNG